ncbi:MULTISPECIES: ATP synthase F1 subunit delta [unclassified Okeania]|uniref:ATP synthase F1 subunit delta n=1 Tax=unclassified Okeania TaxID=2634635 RepID=UPI0013B6655A|nr:MULTISPECIES: ATP synthase F1 subunit delta [unclassified Okeania]NES75833.1 F0F1 ATP synthase subunit delta [Okeania sp. SIO1H4]NET15519.1 F0F1 ATP synthase subunit delta [Okeania sp. SIO1H6]NET20017.1 F0F1 ATP synthase subunit delta [Okeania sp. SIO1H5]NET91851.1 F0F1 ATP synthase subunit delta [Okeania sp. SIO1H2]
MTVIAGEIVEPYAAALMSLAKSKDLAERFGEDIRSLINIMDESPELKQFMGNPIIKPEDKKAVLQRMMGDEAAPYMRNFLMLLVDRGRIIFLEEIGKKYLALLRELNQTVLAEVTSAVELNEDQKNTVRERVKSMTDARDVDIETKIDSSLLGGVIIKIGSQIIDSSLQGQLRRIGNSLKA